MNQLAKEYIENYLEFANKLTQKALECNKESTGSTIAANEQAIKAATLDQYDRWLFDAYKFDMDFCIKTSEERIRQIQEINKKIIRNNIITATCVVASAIINIILLITLWI